MISLKDILNEETILVRRVDSKAVETFLKKYPKVKQIMTTLAQKNTDLMRGYKAFLKFKDKQEDYLGGRGEEVSSATFGSKIFYKYEFGAVKGGWPELYQYIYTLRYGGLDGAKVESVNEVTLQKGKTYGGTKCEGGCFIGKEGLKKIIKISKDSPKDVFMFRDDNYSGLQPHFVKDGVIAKATVLNPAYDLERHKVRTLNIGKDVILSVRLFVSTNESINELTHNEKSIRDGNPNNVYYAFYKGQFEAIYSSMGPSGLFDMYWDKFKVRRQAGSKFKLNPEFVLISKKDYDSSTSNRYAKLKPHVDKLWDTLKTESVNEGKYYVTYNLGRGRGKDLEKEFDQKTFKTTNKPKVFDSYNDAKKYAEKMEKMFQHSIGGGTAYWVSDEKMNPIKESINEEKVYIDFLNKAKGFKQDRIKFNSYEDAVKWARKNFDKFSPDMIKYESVVNEGRGIKSIQNDLNKTIAALESEISDYKSTKGTPQEKKHIDNLKKLHPIKKKLEAELEMAVSGLYRDAELKIED